MKKALLGANVFLLGFLTLLLFFNGFAYSVVLDDTAEQEEIRPQYVPGEVLVKFREGIDPQLILQDINLNAKGIERLYSIKPSIVNVKQDYDLKKDGEGWYWFRGKQYREAEDISDEELFREAYEQMGVEERSLHRTYKIILPEEISIEEAIAQLEGNPEVEYAQPNHIFYIQEFPQTLPDDTYINPLGDGVTWSTGAWEQDYEDMYGLKNIEADKAWPLTQGEGIIVAVIDTGADYNHSDIAGNMWTDGSGHYGYDFVNNDDDPMDGHGHGTHVAGTIAAVGNNGAGVVGVAPQARIMALKGFSDSGFGSDDTLANAIRYAADNGAKVLNNSWGPLARNPSNPILEDAVDYADSAGCIVVFAAGNSNDDVQYYSPANYSGTVAVAAIDHDDEKASFSNYGSLIDVAAPGVNILSLRAAGTSFGTSLNEYYTREKGTSMACPHVSGMIALALSGNPDLDIDTIRRVFEISCDDIGLPGRDDCFGYGRINPYRAFNNSPTLYPIGDKWGREDDWFTIPRIKATDPDSDTLTVDAENLPAGVRFFQTASSPGSVEYKLRWPDKFVKEGMYENVIFTARDGKVGEDSETITITIVDAGNRAPVLRPINDREAPEKEWFVISKIIATDPDNDTLTIEATNLPSGARFLREDLSAGYAEYKLKWPDRFVKEGIYENITFTARDGVGGETFEAITITIYDTGNNTPILRSIGNRHGTEGEWFVISKIIATDDDGDTLTIDAENLPSGARFFNVNSRQGYTEYKLKWPDRFVKEGVYGNIVFTASDGELIDEETITVTISPDLEEFVAMESTWRYLDDGSDQDIAWREVTFDDSLWAEGPAQLGYGDGDEATVVNYGEDPDKKYIATYFRHEFDIADTSSLNSNILTLRGIIDDGAVIYLNGTEVFRPSMPRGIINYTTQASSGVGIENESEVIETKINPNLLNDGKNVLAVEIHQYSSTSPDISFDLELIGETEELSVTEGPYLQNVTQDSIVIMWETSIPTPTALEYVTPLGQVNVNFASRTFIHEIEITGLEGFEHGSSYDYRVSIDGEGESWTDWSTFYTAPDPDEAFRLVVYGDTQIYAANHAAVVSAIVDNSPDLVLKVGDNVQNGRNYEEWEEQFFTPAAPLMVDTSLFSAIGNHEYDGRGELWYYDLFSLPGNEQWYAFTYGCTRIIALDTNVDLFPGSEQYEWLVNELESNEYDAATWKFVYFHHPPYTSGVSHNGHSGVQTYLVPLFEQHGVTMVLSGHIHNYERSYKDGIYYIVTGGGGSALADFKPVPNKYSQVRAKTFHHCVLDITPTNVEFNVFDNEGAIFDKITILNE